MYFLEERDKHGAVINRYNLDTDTSLTKAKLVQVLKLVHDDPGRYAITLDEHAQPHPSEGIEPRDHMDVQELIAEYRKDLDATGYTLDQSDFSRIALLLSDAFQQQYGVKPRSVNRPSPHNPKIWSSRKLAYPPVFFEAAKAVMLAYCQERLDKILEEGLREKARFKRKKPTRPEFD